MQSGTYKVTGIVASALGRSACARIPLGWHFDIFGTGYNVKAVIRLRTIDRTGFPAKSWVQKASRSNAEQCDGYPGDA